MKKNVIAIVLIIISSYIVGIFMPWWALIVPCIIIGALIDWRIWQGFIFGFLGVFILYFAITFGIDRANDHILSTRLSHLFQNIGTFALMLISSLLGALLGGLATALGTSLRPFFTK